MKLYQHFDKSSSQIFPQNKFQFQKHRRKFAHTILCNFLSSKLIERNLEQKKIRYKSFSLLLFHGFDFWNKLEEFSSQLVKNKIGKNNFVPNGAQFKHFNNNFLFQFHCFFFCQDLLAVQVCLRGKILRCKNVFTLNFPKGKIKQFKWKMCGGAAAAPAVFPTTGRRNKTNNFSNFRKKKQFLSHSVLSSFVGCRGR